MSEHASFIASTVATVETCAESIAMMQVNRDHPARPEFARETFHDLGIIAAQIATWPGVELDPTFGATAARLPALIDAARELMD